MANTDRQAEQGSWWLPVNIQAGDTLADVRGRILSNLRLMVESHAPPSIPRSVALRLLAESDESVMAWTGHTAHPNPSSGAQGREGFVPRGVASTAGPQPGSTGYTVDVHAVDAQGREVPLPPSSTMVAESGTEREGGAALGDHPLFQGYSGISVRSCRAPSVPTCDLCVDTINPGETYKRVAIGCQRFRCHDACLARVQRQIATALESSDPATEDEPEEDSSGND